MTGVVLTVLACVVAAPVATRQDDYTLSIETWRAEREARLTADDGWLTVAGLFFLREGNNSFGTGPLNDIVLPEGPEQAGIFQMRGRTVSVSASPGRTLTVDGVSVSHAPLYPRESGADLTIGGLTLFVHLSGERLAIRTRDRNSEIRRNFTGLHWYPVDQSYRIRARFVPHDVPITVPIQNILGDIETYTSNGSVTLSVRGQEIRMLPLAAGDQLWFIFRDLTSGTATYPAAIRDRAQEHARYCQQRHRDRLLPEVVEVHVQPGLEQQRRQEQYEHQVLGEPHPLRRCVQHRDSQPGQDQGDRVGDPHELGQDADGRRKPQQGREQPDGIRDQSVITGRERD